MYSYLGDKISSFRCMECGSEELPSSTINFRCQEEGVGLKISKYSIRSVI